MSPISPGDRAATPGAETRAKLWSRIDADRVIADELDAFFKAVEARFGGDAMLAMVRGGMIARLRVGPESEPLAELGPIVDQVRVAQDDARLVRQPSIREVSPNGLNGGHWGPERGPGALAMPSRSASRRRPLASAPRTPRPLTG